VGPLIEIILFAQDMGRQVGFYRDVMGLSVTYPAGLLDYSDQHWVTLSTGACTLCLHSGGKGRVGEDAPKFVFRVDEIFDTRQLLIQRGVQISEVRTAAPGVLVADGRDPEGNAFSLESRAAD
jgi:predicted enzyme related to lactoylglutathione lyase